MFYKFYFVDIQMANWSFRDALEELEVKGHFNESMLRSNIGLRLGDIRFAEIQTTLRMHAVYFSTFIWYVEQGCFNVDKLPIDGCSQTTAILLAFIPDWRLEDIESMGIGNVIRRRGSPIGDLSSIKMVIDTIRSVLGTERKKSPMKHWVYMVLIGNYGGHMAFATDPPYCVAYSAWTTRPMIPHKWHLDHTQNHSYAMVTTNMIVRRLLSSPHWEPMVRKQTKGGCLLIPRGMQFGPTLFPEIVVPRNHVSLPVDPVMQQEAPFRTVGPFWAIDSIFLSFLGGLELFTAEEVVKLKELGVLNPPNAMERPPLFLPLVSSSWDKIVSAALGAPPPGFEAHGIEQSLMTNRDEESVLSDSYSDRHSVNVDSSTTWGKPTIQIYERESKSCTTEWKDRDSHRSSEKDRDKNRDRSKKSDNWHVIERSRGHSPLCRDHEGDHTSNGKCERSHVARKVHPTAAKTSRNAEEAPVHHMTVRSRTLLRVDLCHLHPCSIPLLYRCCAGCLLISQNPAQHTCTSIRVGARFLPLTWVEVTPVPSCLHGHAYPGGCPVHVIGPSLPSTSTPTVNFSEDHIKQIFSLTCEGRHLKERIMREFVRLSSQEVLFRTQVQSTGHKSLAGGHPDCFTMYYKILQSGQQPSEAKDKAMEEIINQASHAWLKTNAALFKHILDYEAKLEKFLNKAGGWIREQEEHIWTKMFEITGDAGTPLCTSLNIMLCLFRHSPFISGKPFIPEQFTHHMWFRAWSLYPALVGAPRHGSSMPPFFQELQEGHRCFEGSYYPEYRSWYSLQSECRSVHIHLHRTHTDWERCQCAPTHLFLRGPLSIQMQMCQVPFSAMLAVWLLFQWGVGIRAGI